MALALLALGAGWLLFPLGAELAFKVDGARISDLARALVLVPLLDVPRIVCSAALQGERRMAALARVDLGHELCRLVLVVSGALIAGVAWGAVLGLLVSSLGSAGAGRVRPGRQRPGSGLPTPGQRWRPAWCRRPPRCGASGSSWSGRTWRPALPTLILGASATRAVAYLRSQRGAVARVIMQGVNRTALPALSELAGVRDVAGLRRTYWKASLLSGATISLGLVLALPVLPVLLPRLFPPDFVEPLWTMVLILTPGLCVVSFSVANDVFYLVTDQMHVAIKLSLVGLVVNTAQVALFAWWLPTIGVAIGLTVTCLWSLVHLAYAWRWFRRHPELQEAPASA